MFEFFEHEADLGLRVEGHDLEALFAEGVRALTACHTDLDRVGLRAKRVVEAKGSSPEDLFIHWLKEWLFLQDCEGFLAARATVRSLSNTTVIGVAEGEIRNCARHKVKREIKGITYHGAKVTPTEGGWTAEVILDV